HCRVRRGVQRRLHRAAKANAAGSHRGGQDIVITDEQLKEWSTLCDKATQGPWRWFEDQYGNKFESATGETVAFAAPVGYQNSEILISPEDAAFIAAARTAVPALIDATARARTEVDDLRRMLGEACNAIDETLAFHGHPMQDASPLHQRWTKWRDAAFAKEPR